MLFSDEKCFFGKGFCGRVWVRREKGGALNSENCVDKVPCPVKVNMWACFSAAGQGYMHNFNENMDSQLYSKIFKDNAAASADEVLPES